MQSISEEEEQQQQQTTATILDEYCRYYSDFSKILNVYIKNFYPQLHFQFEQLLDASYNVWHRLNDEEKISIATFLEEITHENTHIASSSSKIKTFNNIINSEILTNKLKSPNPITITSLALNTSSSLTRKKPIALTPYNIYLKDERQKLIKKHTNMSIRDINKRLSERWQKMSHRMKQNYEYRSYLAKKRLYKKQGKSVQLKKPSFIK